MGTLSSFPGRMRRQREGAEAAPIAVSPYGFAIDGLHVAWQSVSEIRAARMDHPSGRELVIEFIAAGTCAIVSERQRGFGELEKAMNAVFPATASWRDAFAAQSPPVERTSLYRRVQPHLE